MSKIITTVQQACDEFGRVTAEVKTLFQHLTPEQLNWKPTPQKWSIAQCLDHLIVSNSTYYPQFAQIISGKHHNSLYQNVRFISIFFANYLIKETGPVVNKPMKNPPAFTPSQSEISGTIVADFEKHQNELSVSVAQLARADFNTTILSSPALKIITYKLGDLLTILVGHEQRHLTQAKNVLNHPNFPK